MANEKLSFASDYMEGAHPAILERLAETNYIKSGGYGLDEYSESAKKKIRAACDAPAADVYFLSGGTQANATVITALLKPYQGIIAPGTGHISSHEAGAIEAGGHKVIALDQTAGKIKANQIEACVSSYWNDENHEHMVMPGMVYISQPTEYGTLYSLDELSAISRVCNDNDLYLYIDGARLAYALACPENDVTLSDLARLCDAFYIGGTKCGALLGEAVVFPEGGLVPYFFSIIKQRGALLAKGRVLGLQFATLFTDDLYLNIGKSAIEAADRIRDALSVKGYETAFGSPTNQIFVILDDEQKARLEQEVEMSFWEIIDDGRTILRIATSWATAGADIDKLIEIL